MIIDYCKSVFEERAVRQRVPDARLMIILFGSRARGDAPRGSGVDLIVVSRVFTSPIECPTS